MPKLDHPLCITCRFFYKNQCRRRAPAPLGLLPEQQPASLLTPQQQAKVMFRPIFDFPHVSEGTWCGDHEPAIQHTLHS